MIRDDWVMRQVAALAEALAAVRARLSRREHQAAAVAVADACVEVTGVSLELVDRLPVPGVVGFASGLEPRLRRAFADLLVVAAEVADAAGDAELAARRREKAEAIRA